MTTDYAEYVLNNKGKFDGYVIRGAKKKLGELDEQ